jgi:uncharacterized sulfatase
MSISRRTFIESAVAATAAPLVRAAPSERPNLLWLVWEDIGPHLGCYGDSYSVTPNFDRLAKRGCVYQNVWASAPVCAPARTAIMSSLCPTSTGAEHMRSMTELPAGWKMFPGYLRDAGYYCVNNGKEDYNLKKPAGTWDVSWEAGAANDARICPNDSAARSCQWPLAHAQTWATVFRLFQRYGDP